MSDSAITIVDTGIANTASVVAAFGRLGMRCVLTENPDEIKIAEALILPGVGSFATGMGRLHELGLVKLLQDRIESGRPTLAICLGMQLLAEASDESTGVQGLGVISGRAERFGADVRTPQFGWNTVQPSESFGFADAGYAYYANSYRIVKAPEGWAPAWSDHGGRFVAALRRGRVLACQFHPELSGTWGLGLLGAWSETINADNLESVSC